MIRESFHMGLNQSAERGTLLQCLHLIYWNTPPSSARVGSSAFLAWNPSSSIHANLVYQPKHYFATIIMENVITWISKRNAHPDESDVSNSLEFDPAFVAMSQAPFFNSQRPVLLMQLILVLGFNQLISMAV
jgi:hypothetical protein